VTGQKYSWDKTGCLLVQRSTPTCSRPKVAAECATSCMCTSCMCQHVPTSQRVKGLSGCHWPALSYDDNVTLINTEAWWYMHCQIGMPLLVSAKHQLFTICTLRFTTNDLYVQIINCTFPVINCTLKWPSITLPIAATFLGPLLAVLAKAAKDEHIADMLMCQ